MQTVANKWYGDFLTELPHDPAVPRLGIYSEEVEAGIWTDIYLYTCIQSSIIYSSQKVETTQVSVSRWVDKQNVAYTYSVTLFRFKKEGNFDKPWGHYIKWNKPVSKGPVYDTS